MAELTPEQEAALAAYVEQMYAQWLPAVERAVLGGYTRFGIAPDPAAINTTAALWQAQVAAFAATQLQPIAAEAYAVEDPEGTFTMSDALIAGAAAATAAFLLAQMIDIQADLTTIIATARTLAEAVVAIRDYLNPTSSRWRAKATTVAQTEGDRWVQASTLAAAIRAQRRDGIVRIKEWVSRDDERVRTAHALADGQQRPVEVAFTVGGFPMRYPKDPAAPAELVVNCRCGMRIRRLEGVRRAR